MSGPLRYEWVRISTVRSTWVLIGLGILVPLGFAVFLSWLVGNIGDQMNGPRGQGPESSSMLVIFLPIIAAILCTIGAASFGQEYRHGLIRLTLAQFPRRTPVFAAKALMVIAVIVVAAVLAILAVVAGEALGGLIAGTGLTWDSAAVSGLGLRALLYVVIFVLIAFAITALTRNQPVGIIVPIVLATIAESIVSTIAAVQGWDWMSWVLPFTGALNGVGGEGPEAWGHLAVFGAWFLALAIPAWLLFTRRDA